MPKLFHDTDQTEKDFWIDLSPTFKTLLFWIEKKQSTSGLYDINLKRFCRDYWNNQIKPKDIDLDEFIEQCNEDGKVRMLLVDGGKRLLYTTTIKFQEGKSNSDHVRLVNNFKHRGIIQQLAGFKESRSWAIDQIKSGVIQIDSKLIIGLLEERRTSEQVKLFCKQIAKLQDVKVQVDEETENDKIKKRDGLTCQYCQQKGSLSSLEIEHIVPKFSGGDDLPDNKITACNSCNRIKGTTDVLTFIIEAGLAPTRNTIGRINSLIKRGLLDATLTDEKYYSSIKGLGIVIGIGNFNAKEDSTSFKKNNKPPIPPKSNRKRDRLDRFYTYAEVLEIHNKIPAKDERTQQDFCITETEDSNGKKLWKQNIKTCQS